MPIHNSAYSFIEPLHINKSNAPRKGKLIVKSGRKVTVPHSNIAEVPVMNGESTFVKAKLFD